MKILIATGLYPPDIGGPATYSKILHDELPKYGIEVQILSFGSVRHLPKIIRHFIYFLKVLKQGWNQDIIFAQDPVSVGLPALLAAKILGKKFVLKIVGDYAWEQFQQKIQNSKFKSLEDFQNKKFDFITELRRKIQRWVTRRAEKIIVPSEYLKKIILIWGAGENKINVIYNAVELKGIKPMTKLSAERWLVTVGRLVPWKGMDTLIELMPELLREAPGLKLKIIGNGPERQRLEKLIETNLLREHVEITGELSRNQTLAYLQAADLFILNSAYEGLSHVLIEAIGLGRWALASKAGGNPEVVVEGQNGDLFEYNNREEIKKKIIYYVKEMKEPFKINNKEFFKKFELATMIEAIKRVLYEVIND